MKSLLLTICLLTPLVIKAAETRPMSVSDYNVVWDSPSADCNGSMPIGNGDIGANVWVEDGGDLVFYLSKTDAWDENARLVKLGKMRVHMNPNPFEKGCVFKQELDLKNGVIKITASSPSSGTGVDLRFWIDANHPVVRINGSTTMKTDFEVRIEPWRTERVQAVWDKSYDGLQDTSLPKGGFPYPVFNEPDTIVDGRDRSIVWYHRNKKNEHSVWADTLRVQGLEEFMEQTSDPLLDLTFGVLVRGECLANSSPTVMKTTAPANTLDLAVFASCARTKSAEDWVKSVETLTAKDERLTREDAWAGHKKWWNDFWNRSWIHIDPASGEDAWNVSRGYALQNWMTACAGRGGMPIKFNGSIFTVDGMENGVDMGPDYRRWGPCYWFQNTRLPYWTMLSAGQYDMMRPLFKMYMDALPLAKLRGQTYYGFEGAWFPETMYFWGTYRNGDYGWHRKPDSPADEIDDKFIQYHWSGGIELTAMMLEYYSHTLDKEFLNTTLLPFAKEITCFYDNHYKRDNQGKLVIHPANALEDVWNCSNPAPEIAGLRYVLPQLAKLAVLKGDKERYIRLLDEVPNLPKCGAKDGKPHLLPAQTGKRRSNCEKPECYSLFPFRLYGVGLPELELAKETFRRSPKSMNGESRSNGWIQDPIFAACIGDAKEAARMLVARTKLFNKESRFPAFWGPNFDWTPDQDHGSVNMIALQHMLMQTEPNSKKIHLCPAWPKEWNASFKLHAPGKTTVKGNIRNGKVVDLVVTPDSRRKDIVFDQR